MANIYARLTYQWFDAIAAGRKTAEYRRITPYWENKLRQVKPGDCIVFQRGYSDKTLRCPILSVRKVAGWDLPNAEYNFFKCPNESGFFEINFKQKEPWESKCFG